MKLKLQYFGHLMWRTDSLGKSLVLGKIEGKRRRGWQRIRCWMTSPMQWTWTWANFGRQRGTGRPGMLQSVGLQSQTQLGDWTTATRHNNAHLLHPRYPRSSSRNLLMLFTRRENYNGRLLISWAQDEELILDYPGGPNIIIRVLNCVGWRAGDWGSQWSNMRRTRSVIAGFEDGGRGHEPEKISKQTLPEGLQKVHSPADTMRSTWDIWLTECIR